MTGGTKMTCKLKQTCIFQLLGYISVYNLLLPSGMKVLKGKIIHKINDNNNNKINKQYLTFQWHWSINIA